MKSAHMLFAALLSASLFTGAAFAQASTPPADPVKPAATEPKKDETKKDDVKKDDANKDALVYIHIKTSMGDIYLELDRAKAPISVENFVSYADKGFYDGTIFHRVIPKFMVQGGGMLPDMKEKPTDKPIKNEWQNGLKNVRGTVAMARKGAGPDSPNSATSQFFINVKDNSFLDAPQGDGAAYAVFGKVVAGMEVVDKLELVPTGSRNPHGNVPVTPVVIEKVARMTKEEAAKVTTKN